MKILVAEDEKDIASVLIDFLESIGHSCIYAEDGEIALQVFKSNNFDVLITDIGLPRLNGIELIKEIRKINSTLKIACLSAYAGIMQEDLETLGIQHILEKPINLEELIRILEQ